MDAKSTRRSPAIAMPRDPSAQGSTGTSMRTTVVSDGPPARTRATHHDVLRTRDGRGALPANADPNDRAMASRAVDEGGRGP